LRPITAEMFWDFYEPEPNSGCWLWTGPLYLPPSQYGVTRFQKVFWYAHRLAFFLTYGWAPPAVMHRCDVKTCGNPAHLLPGTKAENNRDRAAKGGYASITGDNHYKRRRKK
jgi:hypothetical protein